jgi:hypothetical protein
MLKRRENVILFPSEPFKIVRDMKTFFSCVFILQTGHSITGMSWLKILSPINSDLFAEINKSIFFTLHAVLIYKKFFFSNSSGVSEFC